MHLSKTKRNKEYEKLLKFPVRTIKSHGVGYIKEGEKLILPLGSCTSVIFAGSNEIRKNIIAANHIQIGQPSRDNDFDAFKLTREIFKGYEASYGILPHQTRALFFIGGRSDSKENSLSNDHKKLLDPGKTNIEFTIKAMEDLSIVPVFQFTDISIALHLIIKENLLFALIRNNEISHNSQTDMRFFYEFVIFDLFKVFRRENQTAHYHKPLRKQKHIFGLSDLVYAFYDNQLESYSYYDGLFYLAEIP